MYLRDMMDDEQYAQMKKDEYRRKKLHETVKNNLKSQRGFGYDYKPLQFDYSSKN